MKGGFGKKVVVMVSLVSILGFGRPVIADTKGVRISPSQSIESVDSIILENAAKSKTILFGEFHKFSGDSDYVITLLRRFKRLGFSYLGLEAVKKPKEIDKHSQAVSKLIQDYKKGVSFNLNNYHGAFSGWPEFIKAALDLGFKIILFDEYPENVGGYGTPRSNAQLDNLKKEIFDKDPNAKAIIYGGNWHCPEQPIYSKKTQKKEETLSSLLEQYTKGRNYSIALRYLPIWEEILLKKGKVNYDPPTTNTTSGSISHLFDLDVSNHKLLEKY